MHPHADVGAKKQVLPSKALLGNSAEATGRRQIPLATKAGEK